MEDIKSSLKIISTSCILGILILGCSHYYYISNTQNVPIFKEQGEFSALFATGGGNEIQTTELQSAYAVTNNIAVMVNYMYGKGGEKLKEDYGMGNYLEGALGYYRLIDNMVVFQIYGGYGNCKQYHQYWSGGSKIGDANLSFDKIFIQPSFSVQLERIDVGISMRWSNLWFNKINNNAGLYSYDAIEEIAKNTNSILFEPALTIRGGWKNFKVQIQYLESRNLSHPNLRFEKSNLSIGLYFSISKKDSKKETL